MPFLVPFIPAIVTAGAAVYSSSQNKSAAKTTLTAQQTADDKRLADAQAARTQITQLQQPYVQGGYSALDAIQKRYGLGAPTPGAAATPSGSTPSYGTPAGGGAPSYGSYLQHNPDLAAEANRVTSDGEFPSVEAYLQWHDQNYPQEGRPSTPDQAPEQVTQTADPAAPPAAPAPADPAAPGYTPPATSGYVPQYTRPDQPTWQGVGAEPGAADLSAGAFEASPYWNLGLETGQRNLNANFGARGLLKSGASIQGAVKFGQDNFRQNYGAWAGLQMQKNAADRAQYNTDRSQEFNIYNTGLNNLNNNFADDRSYGTNLGLNTRDYENSNARFGVTNGQSEDQRRIANLFSLVNTGSNAAGATGNAASNYANNAGNIYGNTADAQGNYASTVANNNSGAVQSIAGQAANLFAGTPRINPTPAPVSPIGTGVSAVNPWTLPDYNSLSRPSYSGPIY